MLALYHFGPVANSLTPLLCLLEKGLTFENRFLDSRKWEHHTPQFQALSPDGMVPILLHEGRVVRESTVINEYLDTVFPELPLRPSDPWFCAEMRVLTKYVDEYVCPALTTIGAHGATAYASNIDKSEMKEILARMPNDEVRLKWQTVSKTGYSAEQLDDARRRLANSVGRIERELAHSRPWLLGDDYTLADIKWYSMVPALPRVIPESCNYERSPATLEWLDRMAHRPAVKALANYSRPRTTT